MLCLDLMSIVYKLQPVPTTLLGTHFGPKVFKEMRCFHFRLFINVNFSGFQVQMQTIAILVAEKQELQHQVHESRSTATKDQHSRQKSQDELRDARCTIQTLEREVKAKMEAIDRLGNVSVYF